ncbi:hypothetical protein A2755_02765 [Candidatus Wolfebacteria bacterium RIFCSPHIGHO2_01_FULL_48_22]|uniref:Uncharacterized protein n=2 Tax=Candidatus Wolfeibacteriota TaxID=1752735 RepID=A0A1F8DRP9_9BACT|nr:MAG: hypothetical protein A2755_02765 [Candidatus Wolfebacteria bacterium RIFCSPHIGHO2_01_FULL_48_22]OGM92210.1 MAG: hypothetical protein A2935_00300 [Candidatus Wolfebacteria bacterium RIFCSPLOWO2_01_FULL_47_17b]
MKTLIMVLFSFVIVISAFAQNSKPPNMPERDDGVECPDSVKNQAPTTNQKPAKKQKYLQIGADPVEWDRVLQDGEMAVKITEDIYVSTLGKSGKRSNGLMPKGTIAIVDAVAFKNGSARDWLIAVCGNPTFQIAGKNAKSLVPLDLSNTIPFAYYSDGIQVDIANNEMVQSQLVYIPDSTWFTNVESELHEISSGQKRIESYFVELFEKLDKKSYFERNWGWIVPLATVVIGAVIYLLIPEKETKEIHYDNTGWVPPGDPKPGKRLAEIFRNVFSFKMALN